ncbi:hypothetical protein BGW39_006692 [Mortierella sp. 14UC]|nr:hypothetical protein BGW39_006692 [Mortierella sp. 14UC]
MSITSQHGTEGFLPLTCKKRHYDPTPRHSIHHHLPDGATLRVDVLSFFNNIRRIYTKHPDKTKAHTILFEHIKKYGNPSRMVFYVDGAPALEKQATHCLRDEKRVKAIKAAEVAVEKLSDRVNNGKNPTKQMFKDIEKGVRGGFKWSYRDREGGFCQVSSDVMVSRGHEGRGQGPRVQKSSSAGPDRTVGH